MNLLKPIGRTPDNKIVLAGAFQMSDAEGFPLECSIEQATRLGCVISLPHFFASAIEHGWTDEQAFSRIKEGVEGPDFDFEALKQNMIFLFMGFNKPGMDAVATAKKMRQTLEGVVE